MAAWRSASAKAAEPCAYHAAVLAPKLDALSIRRFRTVLVYDTPVTLGVLDALKSLAPEAQLAVAPHEADDAGELLAALRFDRAWFIPFYQALRKGDGSFYNREALLDHLAAGNPSTRAMHAVLAADISLELGFLEAGDGASLRFAPPQGRRELPQSDTFQRLASLFEMHEHAKNATRREKACAQTHNHEEEQP